MTTTVPDIAVTFNPEEWVNAPGHLDDGSEKQLIPVENRDSVTFVVGREDGTDEEGTVFPDKSYEANQLRSHPAAPDWVQNWEGPNRLTTSNTLPVELGTFLESSRLRRERYRHFNIKDGFYTTMVTTETQATCFS